MTTENERLIVLDILMEVLEQNHYSHLVIRQALAKYGYLPKQSRAFISRLARGCVEELLLLDAMIDQVSSVKTKKMKPVIRNILRMTAYQLKYMHVPAHAACNEAVKIAGIKGFRGLQKFVNGVSRNIARLDLPAERFEEHIRYSVPLWLYQKIKQWYPKQADSFFASLKEEQEHGLYAHYHLSKASEEEITSSLAAQGVKVSRAAYADHCVSLAEVDRVESLEAFAEGWIQIQDISSALCAQCVSPKEGSRCLDICSAPGGKSIWMAESMRQTGLVVCRDISEEKLPLIEENRMRCGLTNMHIEAWDACVLRPEDERAFDYVLADVPCSGLGVIRRKPDIRYQMTEEKLTELVSLQRQILAQAASYVKPGGVLVYSTCTINPDENEGNVRWLLSQGGFELESFVPYIHQQIEGASPESGMIQLLPGQNRCDGFFLARLRKKGE